VKTRAMVIRHFGGPNNSDTGKRLIFQIPALGNCWSASWRPAPTRWMRSYERNGPWAELKPPVVLGYGPTFSTTPETLWQLRRTESCVSSESALRR
jgi:hypothetical protein